MTAQQHRHAPTADRPPEGPTRAAWAASLLTEQLCLYRRLDALSRRQGVLIDDDHTDELLAVLGERQVVVDAISAIGIRLEPVRASWDTLLGSLPDATRAQLSALVGQLSSIAGDVAGRDEDDRRRLEARRSAVGQELNSVSRGRSAVAAYGGRVSATPFFQDREV